MFTNAAIKAPRIMMRDLTGHKITDRKRGATLQVRLRLKFEKPRRIGRARLTRR